MQLRLKHIILALIFSLIFSKGKAQDTTVKEEAPTVVEVSPDTESSNNYSRYQFKENSANTVDAREVSSEQLSKIRSDEDYWYVNEPPPREKKELPPPEKKTKPSSRAWLDSLFWIILVGGFLAVVIWFLATSNIRLFRRSSKTIEETPEEEELTENIFELNFEREIQRAIDAKNYRSAVRLLYLRTLRDLSNRDLVTYTHEKTNSDYLFQLAGSSYYRNFFRLTRSFDYVWYGQFQLSEENFAVIQNDFAAFKKQLS